MGQTSLISNFDDGNYYYYSSEVFLARTHVEASLRDGLIMTNCVSLHGQDGLSHIYNMLKSIGKDIAISES